MSLISPELTYTQATKILHIFSYWSYYDRGYGHVNLYVEKLNKKADCLNSIYGRDLGWVWCDSHMDKLSPKSKYRIKIEYHNHETEKCAMYELLKEAGVEKEKKPERYVESSDEEEYF